MHSRDQRSPTKNERQVQPGLLVVRDRILDRVANHLGSQRRRQIDVQLIRDREQIRQAIRDLFPDIVKLLLVVLHASRFIRRQPLEMLHQLSGFNRQRHHQILRLVEFVPIPFINELMHDRFQFIDGGNVVFARR